MTENKTAANVQLETSPISAGCKGESNFTLTQHQYKQFMRLIPQSQSNNSNAETDEELDLSFACMITCLHGLQDKNSWVIDSRATDHMSYASVGNKERLKGPKIYLPSGQTSDISSKGHVQLANGLQLKDVLHVPTFKYNLLSISKLVTDNQCFVTFYPTFYLIQDCASKKL